MAEIQPFDFTALPIFGAAILLLIAIYSDITRFQIPNLLCLALALLFLVFGYLNVISLENALLRVGIGGAVLVVGMVLNFKGYVGGGDVKLLAAMSLWIFPADWPLFMLSVMIFGGILALAVLILRKLKARLTENVIVRGHFGNLLAENEGIPYGVAIGLAGLIRLGDVLEGL
ncbi:MAG: hypothetical protein HN725_06140 [Alphaproteobacteria bacterium]|jgi:prepilin peptidase CpaA|nr:hypothetical protein [Alphaproteobacteria bacterium]MBT4084039.1 hypothetical protein [Alphaproteobacteria bacterium]MBT4545761.1 hypothetical protein [Alphaproteobacteria bacterium]MBT7744854.1 hypothetical protein [Alphaproteobacteria bacterium]